jgi:hypothetical protein
MDEGVTPRIAQTAMDSTNARATAEFWRGLVGLVYREGHAMPAMGQDDRGARVAEPAHPRRDRGLAIQQVDEMRRAT